MAGLGRSLSLNTGGSSLFGNSNQTQQPSGGLFGSTSTSQPAQTGGLFAGQQASGAQPAGGLFGAAPNASKPGGLFGAAAPAPSQTTGGSLFGGATNSSQPATGSLFGAAQAAPSQPAVGGLFGGTANPSAPPAGGLFGGGGSAAPAASSAPAGGLFGRVGGTSAPNAGFSLSTSTATTSAPAGGGLFGGAAAAQSAPSGGLFGSTAASQPAPSGGLFGASAAQPQQPNATRPSLFGALSNSNTVGAGQPSQQVVPAVQIDWSNVKPTTRFSELHGEVQETIVLIDDIIQGAIRASMQCSEAAPSLGRVVEALPESVEYLDRRVETVEGALGRDAVSIGHSKGVIEKDIADASTLFRAIENLKLPNQFHYSSMHFNPTPVDPANSSTDLLNYFDQRAHHLEEQEKVFGKHQREVELHLRTVEQSALEGIQKLQRRRDVGAEDAGREGLREVAGVMRTFEEAILRVAERVGESREKVVDLSLSAGLR